MLGHLRQAGLKLSPEKCTLFAKEVACLGHVIGCEGVKTDPGKIKAVEEWPIPSNIKDVRCFFVAKKNICSFFCGICFYDQRFVAKFAEIARPLHQLTEKGTRFNWTWECNDAFLKLKVCFTSTPVLAFPTDNGTFTLNRDVSLEGLGAVLSQTQEGVERVITYTSRAMSRPMRNYCVTRKELLAMLSAMNHFHPYLYGGNFRFELTIPP